MPNRNLTAPLHRALAELENERRSLDHAITQLKQVMHSLSANGSRSNGRVSSARVAVRSAGTAGWSPAKRRAAAARMRRFWAARRKGKTVVAKKAGKKAGRRKAKWSPAARKAAAERMRRFWAARRSAQN